MNVHEQAICLKKDVMLLDKKCVILYVSHPMGMALFIP